MTNKKLKNQEIDKSIMQFMMPIMQLMNCPACKLRVGISLTNKAMHQKVHLDLVDEEKSCAVHVLWCPLTAEGATHGLLDDDYDSHFLSVDRWNLQILLVQMLICVKRKLSQHILPDPGKRSEMLS